MSTIYCVLVLSINIQSKEEKAEDIPRVSGFRDVFLKNKEKLIMRLN